MITYVLLALLAAMAVLNALQLTLLVRLARRVTNGDRSHERLAHFAEALTLLTDTTEQGLANVAASLNAVGQKPATRSTTKATTRRIVSAVKKGKPIAAIAEAESMSESEIRLHLELGGFAAPAEAVHGSVRI
ncbi:MAG: hypothetical protein U0Q55_01785 [Vicinamibacterales bacterium]